MKREHIHYAYAGVRPLPHKEEGPESAITRRHIIMENKDIARGLLSVIGGKLTTYRNLAEQVVDKVGKVLRRRLPECRTRSTDLPGAWGIDRARDALDALGILSEVGIERLLSIYGGRASGIVDLCADVPALGRTLDAARTVLAAEVAFVIRQEFAASLQDIVFRRMMIGFDADQGREYYEEIAALAAAETGWSPEIVAQQLGQLREYASSLRVG